MSAFNDKFLRDLFLKQTPLIDVRAPVEFSEGSIPYSINLPIIDNEQRVLIGTCYKQHGQASAVKLGHELVNGSIKEKRVSDWLKFLEKNPTAQVFCFRGGMRSQISCQWLKEKGINKEPIPGGYKKLRRFFISQLDEAPLPSFLRIGGCTGSGKTRLLKKITNTIDLENLANHRGSAFGENGVQPSQTTFENLLALELLKNEDQRIVIEDESIMIGRCKIPKRIHCEMGKSSMINLKIDHDQRIQNIFEDYILKSNKLFFLAALERIKKRISRVVYTKIVDEVNRSFDNGFHLDDHALWITPLLENYYDPLYQKDIRRQQSLICFEGNEKEVLEYLKAL